MQLKVTEYAKGCLVEIMAENGEPASPQNPIYETKELSRVQFPDIKGGKLVVVSGMPMSAVVMTALRYKNMFGAVAINNPRLGYIVVHSTTPEYPVGTVIDNLE